MRRLVSGRALARVTLVAAGALALPVLADTVTLFGTQGPKLDFSSAAPPPLEADITSALTMFRASATVLGEHGFENGQTGFSYAGGVASLLFGTPTVVDGNTLSDLTTGRYNMTLGLGTDPITGADDRGKWLEGSSDFTYGFATGISALGFFGMDFGDFDGVFSIDLFNAGNRVFQSSQLSNPGVNGNLLFWGIASTDFTFDSATFRITQRSTTNIDVLGFDSMMVGTAVAAPPNGVPEPGSLALAGLSLALMSSVLRRRPT